MTGDRPSDPVHCYRVRVRWKDGSGTTARVRAYTASDAIVQVIGIAEPWRVLSVSVEPDESGAEAQPLKDRSAAGRI